MKVREDKMANYLGLRVAKPSWNYCVAVLFRVGRKYFARRGEVGSTA